MKLFHTSPRKKDWYDIYVFPGKTPYVPISYSNEYKAIRTAHMELGIQTTVRTQTGRKRAANAENFGAKRDSLNKHGKWAVNSRDGAYAHHAIPWDAVRVLSGFPPEPGRYYLKRNLLIPPKELQMRVFPFLEEAKEQMLNGEIDLAGQNFMELFFHLRIVLLQDAAMLLDMEDFKLHPALKQNVCHLIL